MARFQVQTNQGTFELDIDKENPTQKELEELVQQQLTAEDIKPGTTFKQALIQGLKEEAPEIAGGVAGEIGGAAIGALVGRPLLGATLGGGVGQALGGAIETGIDRPPTTSEQIVQTLAPITGPGEIGMVAGRGIQSPQDIRELATDFAIGASSTLGGAAISAAAKPIIAPFKKLLISNFGKLKNVFARVGGRFTPGQATREAGIATIIDFAEEFTEGSVTGSGPIRAFKELQQKKIVKLADDISKSITGNLDNLGDDEIGDFVLGTLKQGSDLHQAAATGLYAQLDTIVGKSRVPTAALKVVANKFNIPEEVGRQFVLSSEMKEAIQAVNSLGETLSFTETHAIRSGILKKIRDLGATPGKSQAAGQLKQLVGTVDEAMANTAKNLSGDAVNMWRTANSFVKEGKEIFNNKLLTKILQKKTISPEKIGEKVFARGNIQDIRSLKNALSITAQLDPTIATKDVWKAMQAGHLRQLLKPDAQGQIIGNKLISLFNDPKQLRTLKEIYSAKQLVELKNLAKVAQATQRQLRTGGAIAAKIMQIGAAGEIAFNLAQGQSPTEAVFGPGGAILLGPAIFARIATSPTGIKWLTQGFQANLTGRIPSGMLRTLGTLLNNLQENQ